MEMINEFDLKYPEHSHLTQEVLRWKKKYEEVKGMLLDAMEIMDGAIDEQCEPLILRCSHKMQEWWQQQKEKKDERK